MQMALFLGSTKTLDGSKFKHACLRITFYPTPCLYLTLDGFFKPLDLSKKNQQKFMMIIQNTHHQWEFQDPKMEVLYHIRPYFGGISLYIGLI